LNWTIRDLRTEYVTDRITSLDDTDDALATFTKNGLNTNTADNSAIFLGIDSDSTPIDR
jgi:hypothetical protein